MSGFTESGFERKLAELNSTQLSIQTLSMWLIHHRKHCNSIVKVWYKEFHKAQEHRKLTFVFLANDVIQNSKKKGGEFGKAFAPIFKKALEYMARNPDDKVKRNILRILKIWDERGIYETNLIKDFESSYRKAWDDLHGPDVDELIEAITTPPPTYSTTEPSNPNSEDSKSKDKSKVKGKQKEKDKAAPDGKSAKKRPSEEPEPKERKKRHRTKREELEHALRKRSLEDTNTIEEWEVDGVSQIEIKLSPSPYKDPPTEEELIAFIKSLEKMPSTDAATRGKIANLPPELSDLGGVANICIDSDVSRDLVNKIKSALDLLKDYNRRLDNELEDRKKVSMKLQDLIYFQKDLLTQAEHRLEEHQNYAKMLSKKLDELKAHVQSMPDLSKLPSVTDGLAPLPSAGDLFNI